jgi:hypothetical protein
VKWRNARRKEDGRDEVGPDRPCRARVIRSWAGASDDVVELLMPILDEKSVDASADSSNAL